MSELTNSGFTETTVPTDPTVEDVTKVQDEDPDETWIVFPDGLDAPDKNGFQAPHFSRITTAEYAKRGL